MVRCLYAVHTCCASHRQMCCVMLGMRASSTSGQEHTMSDCWVGAAGIAALWLWSLAMTPASLCWVTCQHRQTRSCHRAVLCRSGPFRHCRKEQMLGLRRPRPLLSCPMLRRTCAVEALSGPCTSVRLCGGSAGSRSSHLIRGKPRVLEHCATTSHNKVAARSAAKPAASQQPPRSCKLYGV